MIRQIQTVTVKENYVLEALFASGETKQYDMTPVLENFPQIKDDAELLENPKVSKDGRTVSWGKELKLDSKAIWNHGVLLDVPKKPTLNHLLAYQLLVAREKARMTQSELAQKTGIYQADISKLERGIGNPSIGTLNRLVEGLDMVLKIEIVEK
ncbi:MAG: helix-turn-helix transcriptional regulator [Lachnospiraceae bacterium]|nr:helix-turn-helix transcriptional regulator [Lachnospiraceae bacterium]